VTLGNTEPKLGYFLHALKSISMSFLLDHGDGPFGTPPTLPSTSVVVGDFNGDENYRALLAEQIGIGLKHIAAQVAQDLD